PTAVLVPLKGFRRAKGRLADRLDEGERADLAERLAETVLAAAGDLPVLVVHDDDETGRWAEARGAAALRQRAPGLNAAVSEGVEHLRLQGFEEVIVAHGDLPLATTLAGLAGWPGVTLVPDRRHDGTNVLVVPLSARFAFAYGRGALGRHRAEAVRLGLPVRELDDPALGWDVDDPGDLAWPEPGPAAAPAPEATPAACRHGGAG